MHRPTGEWSSSFGCVVKSWEEKSQSTHAKRAELNCERVEFGLLSSFSCIIVKWKCISLHRCINFIQARGKATELKFYGSPWLQSLLSRLFKFKFTAGRRHRPQEKATKRQKCVKFSLCCIFTSHLRGGLHFNSLIFFFVIIHSIVVRKFLNSRCNEHILKIEVTQE